MRIIRKTVFDNSNKEVMIIFLRARTGFLVATISTLISFATFDEARPCGAIGLDPRLVCSASQPHLPPPTGPEPKRMGEMRRAVTAKTVFPVINAEACRPYMICRVVFVFVVLYGLFFYFFFITTVQVEPRALLPLGRLCFSTGRGVVLLLYILKKKS